MNRAQILNLKETLKENLSGEQIEFVLDSLIQNPIMQLMRYTTLVEDTLSESLPLIYANQKRKLAIVEGQPLINAIFSIILSKDIVFKTNTLQSLQLERSIYFCIFENFVKVFKSYKQNMIEFLRLNSNDDLDKKLLFYKNLIIDQGNLRLLGSTVPFQEFINIQNSIELAYKFRAMLTEKYVRFVHGRAIKFQKGTGLTVDLDDLFQNMLISIPKATNKYRAEKGLLTSHIEWWLKDAVTQNASSHEYGTAYHIPPSKRRKMQRANETLQNFSNVIDDNVLELEGEDSLEQQILRNSNDARIARIAAEADRSRLGFLELGFVYMLSNKEKRLMKKSLLKGTKK